MTIDAVILAGRRPGPDALIGDSGVATKAVMKVAGTAMLVHVARALRSAPSIGRITVLAQNSADLARDPALAALVEITDLAFADSGAGISRSLAAHMQRHAAPLLVTTADNVLLTAAIVEDFVHGAAGRDVAVGMVERRTLAARYPQSRRTWLKFRGGWWSGANLFHFGGAQILPLLDFWSSIEQDRKKGLKIIAAFGPMLLIAALFRLLTVHQGVARAGRRFGLDAAVVPLAQAEACIDADKPADIALIEQILARGYPAAASAASTAAIASASSRA